MFEDSGSPALFACNLQPVRQGLWSIETVQAIVLLFARGATTTAKHTAATGRLNGMDRERIRGHVRCVSGQEYSREGLDR